MTQTQFTTSTSTFVANNKSNKKAPIGVISYNSTTGQVRQCEVFAPFWEEGTNTPDTVACIHYLFERGFGLIRLNTLVYNSLV